LLGVHTTASTNRLHSSIPLGVTFSKVQSSELERLFCHFSVNRDVRTVSCELLNSIRKRHPKWDWLYWCGWSQLPELGSKILKVLSIKDLESAEKQESLNCRESRGFFLQVPGIKKFCKKCRQSRAFLKVPRIKILNSVTALRIRSLLFYKCQESRAFLKLPRIKNLKSAEHQKS